MAHTPVLSPTHHDNDILILEGVLTGVTEQGAKYGLSKPRRDLLALTLEALIRSLQGGVDDEFRRLLTHTLAGRPSHPEGRDGGHAHVSTPPPELPCRTRPD